MMTPIFTSVIIFLLVLTIISTVGAVLIAKLIPRQDRLSLRVVTQPTLTVTGMMFSVLLGFFIAESLKSYTSINLSLVNEANAVGEVFRDARKG
ncbi:MAG: hypothetical protein K2X93_27575 [Candidatus Obscuribacterales bacterium]|nr:hypothetical protein [Candidatus Obscuribacterales bacterium]